jgi:hypothetical protein
MNQLAGMQSLPGTPEPPAPPDAPPPAPNGPNPDAPWVGSDNSPTWTREPTESMDDGSMRPQYPNDALQDQLNLVPGQSSKNLSGAFEAAAKDPLISNYA